MPTRSRAYVKRHAGQVAAIIVEPIAHNVGALRATDEFLRGLRASRPTTAWRSDLRRRSSPDFVTRSAAISRSAA
jgi:hypothetical protein